MSVNWSWKHKIGEITLSQRDGNNPSKKNYFKINMYSANCVAALIYEFKDPVTKTEKYQFFGFWNDLKHLKNCLGLSAGHTVNIYNQEHNCFEKVSLNIHYKEMLKVAELFAKAGIKVDLYCSDPLNNTHYEVISKVTNKMIYWDRTKEICQNYINENHSVHSNDYIIKRIVKRKGAE